MAGLARELKRAAKSFILNKNIRFPGFKMYFLLCNIKIFRIFIFIFSPLYVDSRVNKQFNTTIEVKHSPLCELVVINYELDGEFFFY